MFKDLLEVSKALVGAVTALAKLGDDRRSRLATYLESIAKTLSSIIERKSKGETSTDLCSELAIYAANIREVTKSTASADVIERLSKALEDAEHSRAMLFFSEHPEANHYDEYVDQLSETAGLLRGIANTLRAM